MWVLCAFLQGTEKEKNFAFLSWLPPASVFLWQCILLLNFYRTAFCFFSNFKVLLEYCYSWFLLRFSRPEQNFFVPVLSVLVQNKLKNLKKLVWCIKKIFFMLTVRSFSNPYWQEVTPFQIKPWQNGAEGDRNFNLRIMQNMSYRWRWQWWWSDCIYHPIHTSLRLEPQPEKETCKPKGKCPAVLGCFLLILWGAIPEEDFDDNYLWLVY